MLAALNTIIARICAFFRPGDHDSDFDQEIAAHLAMAEEDGLRRGLTAEEARRVARVQLGGITQLRESAREARGLPWLDVFALDAKLGLRMLRRSWGLTLAGGLAMTIVITIAAVIFVFLDPFMGRTAPPLDEGERVVALQSWDAEAHRRREVSRADLERWGATLRFVEDLGGFQNVERRLIGGGSPAEWVRVAEITASGFRLARVQPLLGRWIAEVDEHAAAAPVLVIGYDVWQSRFASDRAIIGQTVRLGEITHTVVGVMPEGFAFPVNHRYWIPLRSDLSGSLKPAPEGAVFARLAPGVSLDGAQAELLTVGLLPREIGPTGSDARRPRVVPYTFAFTDDVFFEVFDVPVLVGRTFDSGDFGAVTTAVLDQTFVRQVLGDGNALGRRVRPVPAPGPAPGRWYEIVGVVSDRPANTSQGRMYVTAQSGQYGALSPIQLALHGGPDAAATLRRLQEMGTNLDPLLRLDDVRRLDEVYGETQISSNLTSYALAIVMLSVIVLSAAGLYALRGRGRVRGRRGVFYDRRLSRVRVM